jgi:hypothetical protein
VQMTSIHQNLEKFNQFNHQYNNVKTELKLISEKKRANKQRLKQLQLELRITTSHAKQYKKQGNKVVSESYLAKAFQLLDQITGVKRQILMQREIIEEVLKSS